jgi:catechol 2,3-dioxygenase-like lactoylglutathione lyase family enzyme
MATPKRRKKAVSKKKTRRAPVSRPRPARKAAARKAPARKAPARKAPAARRFQKRRDPETLRLRSLEPSLTVGDLGTSIRFYTEVLGFVVDERWTHDGVLRGVLLKAGVCEIGLSQDDWAKGRDRRKGEGMRIWCATVQDIDALARRIEAAGGVVAEGPLDQSWGARSLSIVDPDGFGLTIYREK